MLQGGGCLSQEAGAACPGCDEGRVSDMLGFVRPWPPSLKGRAMRPCAMSSVSRRSSVMLEILQKVVRMSL